MSYIKYYSYEIDGALIISKWVLELPFGISEGKKWLREKHPNAKNIKHISKYKINGKDYKKENK